jgi:hypothetical protein
MREPMSKHQKTELRDESTWRGRSRPAEGLPKKSRSTEREPATDWRAPDVCTQVVRARSRSSILAPHVGNCSRAVLLQVGDM